MVRRSDHCLPSDSDKFTIKLHSLPSKFPSSALLRALLPSEPALSSVLPRATPVPPPSAPQKLLPLCGHVGAPSVEPVLYSSAITITLCTAAPPSSGGVSPCLPLPPSRCSTRVPAFSSFAPPLSVSLRLVRFPLLFASSLPFASCRFLTPRAYRSPCRIDRGYSAIVFVLSCSCCDCSTPGDSACLPLPRVLYWNLSFSLFFAFFILPLLVVWCSSVGIYFSTRRIYFQAFSFFLVAFFYSPK